MLAIYLLKQRVKCCAVQLLIRLNLKARSGIFSRLTSQDETCTVLERNYVQILCGICWKLT